MTALRDYNAAVDFVDRNVAEGHGDKMAFIDPSRNMTYGELRDAAARIGPVPMRLAFESCGGSPHGLAGFIQTETSKWRQDNKRRRDRGRMTAVCAIGSVFFATQRASGVRWCKTFQH